MIKCRKSNFGQSERLDFQTFPGEHAPDPPSGPKKFFSPLRGTQNFLGTPLKPVKFSTGSAPVSGRFLKRSESSLSRNIATEPTSFWLMIFSNQKGSVTNCMAAVRSHWEHSGTIFCTATKYEFLYTVLEQLLKRSKNLSRTV